MAPRDPGSKPGEGCEFICVFICSVKNCKAGPYLNMLL